jgi:hypothetical protein
MMTRGDQAVQGIGTGVRVCFALRLSGNVCRKTLAQA